MIIGIIGNGFVGKATCQLQCNDIKILAYDLNPDFCSPKGITLEDMNRCEMVFISVPTPMNKDNSCYLGIIKSVLVDLDTIGYKGFRILRSTVPVGTSDVLGCYFMPEFLIIIVQTLRKLFYAKMEMEIMLCYCLVFCSQYHTCS